MLLGACLMCWCLYWPAHADPVPATGPAGFPANLVDPGAARTADELLRLVGRDAGMCLYLGADPKLAVALHVGSARQLLVQQLQPVRVAEIDNARQYIRSVGLYGPVSAQELAGPALPMADNLATIIIIADAARLQGAGAGWPSLDECARVLQPGGAMLIGNAPNDVGTLLRRAGAGGWTAFTKPRPAGMDQWTHCRHGPDGNPVSHDSFIGLPQRIQWLAGPIYPAASDSFYQAILSAGGRNYYLLTAGQAGLATFSGPAVVDDPPAPATTAYPCFLVARDAFNGLSLWRRGFDGGGTALVADDQRIYGLHHGQAVAIDGATGRIVANWGKVDGGSGYSTLLLKGGKLLIAADRELRAIDIAAGMQLWKLPVAGMPQIIADEQLLAFNRKARELRAIDLASGKENWKVALFDAPATQPAIPGRQPGANMIFARDGVVVVEGELPAEKVKMVKGLSGVDGRTLWTYKYAWTNGSTPSATEPDRWNVLYAAGLVWVERSNLAVGKGQEFDGLDLKTGKVVRTVATPARSGGGCYTDVATDRYMIFARPADFMDFSDGAINRFRASRPACRNGATLANGMFYSAPNTCVCVSGVVNAFIGIAASATRPADTPQIRRFGAALATEPAPAADDPADWPTFRHDPARSGASPSGLPDKLDILWQSPSLVCGSDNVFGSLLSDECAADPAGDDRITAPTVAGSLVLVGCPREHSIIALNRSNGTIVWRTTLGGRVDTPPTIAGQLALAGCHDGWVYALSVADGRLVWKFQVALLERRIVAFGQVESPWPVVGGVLVKDGLAIAVAGHSTEADGGVNVCAMQVLSGVLAWEQHFMAPADDAKGFVGLADIAVADARCVSIGGSTTSRMDIKTGSPLPREQIDALRRGTRNGQYHAYIGPVGALMDRTWHTGANGIVQNRFNVQWNSGLEGQLVVFDVSGARVVAAERRLPDNIHKKLATTIVARPRIKIDNVVPILKDPPLWSVELPEQQVESLALASDRLLAAVVPLASLSSKRSAGRLIMLSMKDGATTCELDLPAPATSEAIAVAGGNAYLSLANGHVVAIGHGAAADTRK